MDITDLKACKILVTHGGCPDGIASAIIVRQALPNIEVRFVKYGQASREKLQAESCILFVDMTPPRERAQEFVDAGAIVLDHHKSQRDIVEMFGERGVYADNETDAERILSGAGLAHAYVLNPLTDRETRDAFWLSRLVGIRDTWHKESAEWDDAQAMAAVLFFQGADHWLPVTGCELANGSIVPEKTDLEFGRALMAERMRRAKSAAAGAFRTHIGKLSVAILEGNPDVISDASDFLSDEGADIVAGFSYSVSDDDDIKMTVQLRSRDRVDVSELAKALGGGGHKHAAGFTVVVGAEDTQPFALIPEILNSAIAT